MTGAAPFDEAEEPGIGREGSRYGMEASLEIECLCMGGA